MRVVNGTLIKYLFNLDCAAYCAIHFITLIILCYHNMVGNCKLIIRTLNLISIYPTHIHSEFVFLFRKLKISFSELLKKIRIDFEFFHIIWIPIQFRYSLSIQYFSIPIQILNQTLVVHIQNISNIHNILSSEENSNNDTSNYRSTINFLDRHSASTNFSPLAPDRILPLPFSPTSTYYLDAVSTFFPFLLLLTGH